MIRNRRLWTAIFLFGVLSGYRAEAVSSWNDDIRGMRFGSIGLDYHVLNGRALWHPAGWPTEIPFDMVAGAEIGVLPRMSLGAGMALGVYGPIPALTDGQLFDIGPSATWHFPVANRQLEALLNTRLGVVYDIGSYDPPQSPVSWQVRLGGGVFRRVYRNVGADLEVSWVNKPVHVAADLRHAFSGSSLSIGLHITSRGRR